MRYLILIFLVCLTPLTPAEATECNVYSLQDETAKNLSKSLNKEAKDKYELLILTYQPADKTADAVLVAKDYSGLITLRFWVDSKCRVKGFDEIAEIEPERVAEPDLQFHMTNAKRFNDEIVPEIYKTLRGGKP